MLNRPGRIGISLHGPVSKARMLLLIVLAVLVAATLIFAMFGPGLAEAEVIGAGDGPAVVAGWSFTGEIGVGDFYGTFRSGPSWS